MRNTLVLKVLRDLWLHKSRSALVIAAICIGIVGAGAVLDAWSLVRLATRQGYEQSRPPSAILRVDSVTAALLARVRSMPGIESVASRRSVSATVRTSGGSYSALIVSSADFTTSSIGVIKGVRGAWPPPDGTLVVERSSTEFAQIAAGDSLIVKVGDSTPLGLAVAGIAQDVGVAPGWMEHVVYMFVSPATLARLGVPAGFNELHFRVADHDMSRDAVLGLATRVKDAALSLGIRVSDVSVPVPGKHIHAAQIDSLLFTQGAFAFLTLVLSGLLVVNLIAAMLTGQVREIGVMKAIGGSTSQIASMYLLLALILGVVSCAISIPVAAVLGRKYAEFTGGLLNFDVTPFAIPRWSLLLEVAVGMTVPVLAAAIPVTRGCRIAVGEALRDFGIAPPGSDNGNAFLARFDGLSRPVLLSLRNAFRRRQRLVLTLTTLAVGGAIFLGALNLRKSVSAAVDLLFAPQKFDVIFRMGSAHDPDSLVAMVRALDGVTAVEAWGGARVTIDHGDDRVGNSFVITAPPAGTTLLAAPMAQGRWFASRDANELVVNSKLLADEPSLAVGRTVSLRLNGTLSKWTVVGIAETGPSPAAYAARQSIERVKGSPAATTAVVATNAKTPASRLELIRRLRETLTDQGLDVTTSSSMSQQRSVMEDHLLMVAGFLGDVSILMIVVGGLGLASTMSLSVLERTREIGVLRAIGAQHGAIIGMIQAEGLVIAVLSWLVAIPLSLPMSILLGRAFSRVMLQIPLSLVPEPGGVAKWLGVVVGVSLVACAWPAIRATRITTSAALSYE